MAYDPQAKHQRPKPILEGPAPVDALLASDTTIFGDQGVRAGTADGSTEDDSLMTDEPLSTPAVTPEPANPPPDKLLLNSALVSVLSTLVGALLLRCLWKRLKGARRCRSASDS